MRYIKKFHHQPLVIIAALIITAGIILRLAEFIHCRDLMMDEANVARNLYSDHFSDLFRPQYYGTYAPPFFLVTEKLIGRTFGYGEQALRVYPMVSGIISVFLFYLLLINNGLRKAFWLPLAIFAFGNIYILYSNDVKQYLADVWVVLILLLLTQKVSILATKGFHFFIFWAFAGGLAIWFSMPSLFILLAIGIIYFCDVIKSRRTQKLFVLLAVGIVWMSSFYSYYLLLLKQQIGDEGLQSWHKEYFLKLNLLDVEARNHDAGLIHTLFTDLIGSKNIFVVYCCFFLLLNGIGWLLHKRQRNTLIFTLLPVLCVLVASCFQHFTLLSRVCIFAMPLVLLVVGSGLEAFLSLQTPAIKITASAIAFFCVFQCSNFSLLWGRIEIDELTKSASFARNQDVPDSNIFLFELYEPCLLYYKNIQPNKTKRDLCKNIKLLYVGGREELDSVYNHIDGRSAFIYFWIDDNTIASHRKHIFSRLVPIDSLKKERFSCLVFGKSQR